MKENSVKINYMMNTILKLSGFIFPLITFPYVSRVLSPIGIGKYSFAFSVISYFTIFSQLGIPTHGIRICSKVRNDKEKLSQIVFELFCFNLMMVIITYIAFIISIIMIPRFNDDKAVLLVSSMSIIFSLFGMEWLYQALEQFSYITIRSLIFKIISVGAMFLCVKSEEDYVVYAGITVLASVGSNILNFINLRKYIKFSSLRKPNLKRHLKSIIMFFAMSVATTIYTNLDNVMLGFLSSDVEIGYYSAAVKIKTILVSVVTSLGVVLLPRLSYYVDKGRMKEFTELTVKATKYIFITALSLSIYFGICARETIFILSGEQFSNAILPMKIIMPTVFFIGLSNLTGIQILIPLGKEKYVLISEIIGASIDIIINWLLIPTYGAIGATIGTTIAEAAVLLVQLSCIKSLWIKIIRDIEFKRFIIPLFTSVILLVVLENIDWISSFFKLIVTAVSFYAVYGGGMLLMKEPLCCELMENIKNALLERAASNEED